MGFLAFAPAKGDKPERGIYKRIGLTHDFVFAEDWKTVQTVELRRDEGVFGLQRGNLGLYDFKIEWMVNDDVTFIPLILKATSPLVGAKERETESAFGMSISFHYSR